MSEIEGVNHPSHYNQGKVECIDAMESAYGIDDVIAFCRCNAFKYQWRAGSKIDGANLEKDLKKAQWYQNKQIELEKRKKMNVNNENKNNTNTYRCIKQYIPCRLIEFNVGEQYEVIEENGLLYVKFSDCQVYVTPHTLKKHFVKE